MDIPKLLAQSTALHDACLAEAQTLVDVPGREWAIVSLTQTASLCVDALKKLTVEPQPIIGLRNGVLNRTDLP